MSECPACANQPMARWKRAFVSPLGPVPCEGCDADLKVTWSAYLIAILPGSALFLLSYLNFEEGSVDQYLGFGLGFVTMLLGQSFFMPLSMAESSCENESDSEK